MNDQESKSLRRYVVWGLLGLIILVGASIATTVVFFVSRSSATSYPFFPFPFFPFHFGFLGIILLLFIIFWVARSWFWPWNGSRRAYREYRDQADEILR
jgi:membrane protein implicated in regulation of membrane protease activity